MMNRIIELENINKRIESELISERLVLIYYLILTISLLLLCNRSQLEGVRGSLESLTQKQLCTICISDPISHVLAPCGHTFCATCVQQISTRGICPYCRARIQSKIKFFLSDSSSS